MTKTGMAAKDRELKEKELEETKRSNKEKESNERKKTGAQYVGAVASGLSSIFNPAAKVGGAFIASQRRNDPAFYKNYLNNLDLFTNVATYYRLGATKLAADTKEDTSYRTPGIMLIHMSPVLGSSDKTKGVASLPINQILMRTKEQVLKSNSRSSVPYEAADLGYNLLATASIVAAICDAERALLVAQTYAADNAYFAEGLLGALGWNSTVLRDLPRFRKLISIIIKRFNNACVAPASLSLTKRWMYLNSNILADSPTSTAQLYAYVFDYFWRLSDDTTKLEAVVRNYHTIDSWYDTVSTMIQRLVENPDFQAMYADLRSALGDNLLMLADNIDGNATIAPNFDATARMQLENIESLPCIYNADDFEFVHPWITETDMEVKQTSDGFLYQGDINGQITAYCEVSGMPQALQSSTFVKHLSDKLNEKTSRTFNVHADTVSGDDVLEITRNTQAITVTYEAKHGDDQYPAYIYHINRCGTEVVTYFEIFAAYDGTYATAPGGYAFGTYSVIQGEPEDMQALIKVSALHSTFDWMPALTACVTHFVSAGNYDLYSYTYWDVEHPFDVARSTVADISDACLMSLFYLDTSIFKR